MKNNVYMLINDIKLNRGGATQALMNRANMLNDDEWKADILTLDYTLNYSEIEDKLRRIGRLSEDVSIINIYDELIKQNYDGVSIDRTLFNKENTLLEDPLFVQNDEFKEKNYTRYFLNGTYKKYKKWDTTGNLLFIDYFNENRCRTKRAEFNQNGYHHRDTYFNLNSNQKNQELYYTPDGFCYLSIWYNHENGNIQNVFLFDRNSELTHRYNNLRDLHIHWMNNFFKGHEAKPFVICDGIGTAPKLFEVNDEVVHKIIPIHTNHLDEPRTVGSPVRPNHKALFDRFNTAESIVILTEKQKKDIVKQFGDPGNLDVIPNSIALNNVDSKTSEKKQPYLVSLFSRLIDTKGIPDAITIFSKVVKKQPKATLNIWGSGDGYEKYKQMIKELKMENNIFLKGYCNNVHEEMAKSQAVILTSKYEAFPLVIMEALLNKTPFISYDVKYGPSDSIDDKINGYLIREGDKDKFAKAIIKLLDDPEKVKQLGEMGRKKVEENYSNEVVKKQWIDLFNKLKKANN